ncbi:tRNA (adenosine(37)-N6)-threonylcarbamoyltransferase complex dimerization subunit type 1 TsaB [Cellulomonas composti]|uniref:tRNA (Adenosine(37)-N6)-threonylcarbamoyltransferase complex dimerization subunit type 1 TsaB n=1 Tax=Cellulomonas composti TaxID=266130 RepID=A0A511J915_9CELL|nr:tRNA (adenosine(37)-N6)-threonylcarbamoyltransferase complex dimerization subunit type 1 TsaB [Cellulomonas composti]GEL94486.1 tRNA (adenosine(37)-N6)-threonylcarbamoyltransferase complex dimerization subunit type 1 TsaB [Cellulomonas composti]
MPLLALDTSGSVAVAVTDDAGTALARRSDEQPRHHAELLAPMVVAALAEAGVDRRELTAVVVGTGPAPFTGLRVGLVTARTLALALGIPALGVPSLDALAARAARGVPAGTRLLVATDARRREVYWAVYTATGDGIEAVTPPQVGFADGLADEPAAAGALVVGPGVALYPEAFAHLSAAPGADDPLDPAELAGLALRRRAAGADLPTEPLYLRRPDAVPSAGHRRALG